MNLSPPLKAFAPFFSTRVSVSGKRPRTDGGKGTVDILFEANASVLGGGFADMVEASDSQTTERVFWVTIRYADIHGVQPQTGDKVTPGVLSQYPEMKVSRALRCPLGWQLECRSLEGKK